MAAPAPASPASPAAPPTPVGSTLSHDTHTALRNGVKLAMSLVATWGVGLVVRFWMPRHLGPEQFGLYSFADGLAATLIGCAGLGIDTYIQKEIPVRPHYASDFWGGTAVVRVLLSALLVGALMVLPVGARDPGVRFILLAFGVGQIVYALNGTLAVLLQANTTVDELAIANVAAKIAWGIGIAAGLIAGAPLWVIAAVFTLSEAVKLLLLQHAARRQLRLRFRIDLAATRQAIAGSVGFYANALALALGWRLDVALLGYLAHDTDVGWYGASQSLANITLLMTPLMGSVLAPLLRRAYNRSMDEMLSVMRRALEGLLLLTTPVALFLALGADLWVRVAFGSAYGPAAGSLRTLAPLFVLTYLAILLSMALVVLGRGWTLTFVSLGALVVNAAIALVIVPVFGRWLGPGGAGAGMALASVSKELFVTMTLAIVLGHGFLDKARQRLIARTVLAALVTAGTHALLAPLGYWRLPIDAAVYAVLAVALGVLRPAATLAFARELLNSRRERR
jgi:O-antigen/teichoic acid export membrane protein